MLLVRFGLSLGRTGIAALAAWSIEVRPVVLCKAGSRFTLPRSSLLVFFTAIPMKELALLTSVDLFLQLGFGDLARLKSRLLVFLLFRNLLLLLGALLATGRAGLLRTGRYAR